MYMYFQGFRKHMSTLKKLYKLKSYSKLYDPIGYGMKEIHIQNVISQ